MSDAVEMKAKTILFIEDQVLHFEQVTTYLRLHGYCCRRLARAEAPRLRALAEELRPVAAVVDFVLLSASQHMIDALAEAHLAHRPEPAFPQTPEVRETYGVAGIPTLREACPGIKILIYSQNVKPNEMPSQVDLYGADAGVPKQRDRDGKLTDENAREIAARVRELIE